MKKYLVVTIDVEPDCSPNWRYSDPLEFKGVSIGIVDRLQPLFNEMGIVPTYLINNVVLEDRASVDVFRSLSGRFQLGTHLHPEFIAPQKQFDNYAGKKGVANCCFYPPDIESEKITSITSLFEKAFGYRPTAFRAGRFSAGANTISALSSQGYLVDTSVTPHVCWDDKTREFPVDFTHAPEQPYFIDESEITRPDPRGGLLQVPVSISLVKRNPLKEFISAGAGLRHPFRKYKQVWLRPHYSTAKTMRTIAKQYFDRYRDQDQVVLNMMFHNVEVLPGLSPYTKTEADCRVYLQQLREFFMFCSQENMITPGLSDLYKIYRPH
jgi:hypothetical protein